MAGLLSNEKYSAYYQRIGRLYKQPEIRASLEIILSIFTVTILIFAAIRPTLTNIASLQKKIADQEMVSKKADSKMAQLINAQKQLAEYKNNLYLFDAAVPDEYSYADGAKRVEYLAKRNGLTVESLAFSGIALKEAKKLTADWAEKISKPTKDIIQNKVSFTVNGKPQNIIDFLSQTEKMDRLAVLRDISLTKQAGQTKDRDYLRATGQVLFYFYVSQK